MEGDLTAEPAQPTGLLSPKDDEAPDCSRQLVNWLFSGTLTHDSGAMSAWRELDTGNLAYPYPEITGYALTLAAGTTLSPPQAEIARRAAVWLIARHAAGESESRPVEPGVIYTFDRYVQATGLLNYGIVTGDDSAAAAGVRLLYADAERVVHDRGSHAIAGGSISSTRLPCWSTVGSLHLLKSVQGFCLLREVTGAQVAIDAAEILITSYSDELLVHSPHLADAEGRHYLHPYCYALEGLWVWAEATGDTSHAARVCDCLTEVLRFREPDGGIRRTVEEPGTQFDVTAQAVRLGALLRLEPAAWRGSEQCLLRSAAAAAPDMKYMPYRADGPVHQSSWASMFAAQALRAEHEPIPWQLLV
jgi:hypothetical protein